MDSITSTKDGSCDIVSLLYVISALLVHNWLLWFFLYFQTQMASLAIGGGLLTRALWTDISASRVVLVLILFNIRQVVVE